MWVRKSAQVCGVGVLSTRFSRIDAAAAGLA